MGQETAHRGGGATRLLTGGADQEDGRVLSLGLRFQGPVELPPQLGSQSIFAGMRAGLHGRCDISVGDTHRRAQRVVRNGSS